MRTTLDIDDDVLIAAEELASSKKTTAGKVILELAHRGSLNVSQDADRVRNGLELLPAGCTTVTVRLVDELLDDDV